MRFSAAAVVATSAVVYAQSPSETIYATSTRVSTVIDCADDVPDCPAKTQVEYIPVSTSTIYGEKVHTIIDCGEEVPDCPAHSTIVVTETVPISTTICPVEPTDYPHPPPHGNGTTPDYPPHKPEEPEYPPTKPEEPEYPPHKPEEPTEPECPSYTTTHITKEHVTTITTVETKTVEVPCPPEETNPVKPPVVTPPPHGNETIPKPPPTEAPPSEAGAAGLAGSAIFAAAAGFAAFIFA